MSETYLRLAKKIDSLRQANTITYIVLITSAVLLREEACQYGHHQSLKRAGRKNNTSGLE